jgi:hypothetical protein
VKRQGFSGQFQGGWSNAVPQAMCIQGSYVVQVYCWGLEMDVAVQRTGVDFAAQLECGEAFEEPKHGKGVG